MQAVLYIGHGSRLAEGVEEAIQFIENAKNFAQDIEEICFLELTKPTIAEGIANCIARGATKIAIVPLLLLSAVHDKKDIPEEIQKCMRRYPSVTFTYGKPFGVNEKIVDALYDRIMERKIPLKENMQVLLVGRGSSDLGVKHDLTEIAQLLKTKYRLPKIDICFLYGMNPRFEEMLLQYKRDVPEQVFVIPYLLFTGVLMNNIEQKITQVSDGNLILCNCLGYHQNLQKVLIERVDELLGR